MNLVTERAISDKEVLRRCAVTREARPADGLLRFVADASGLICFDPKRKLPGRGVWVTASQSMVREAVRRKAFQRSLRRQVEVPDDLPERVEKALQQTALGYLALANKAGQVAVGFAKVANALAKDDVAALVHADEAAPDGCRRLDRKLLARSGGDREPSRRIFRFPRAALSNVLGRENVNHAAVLEGGAGISFVAAASRLCHFTECETASRSGRQTNETSAGQNALAKQDTE